MSDIDDRIEREDRAERLKTARKLAGFSGPKRVADALNISIDTYKAHEKGRNGFGTADARAYARLFKVSLAWLYLGVGQPDDFRVPVNVERLQILFERLANAPEDIQAKVISYAEYELRSKSLVTAASPTS